MLCSDVVELNIPTSRQASLDAVISSGPDPPYLSAFQRVQQALAARLSAGACLDRRSWEPQLTRTQAGSLWRWFDKGVQQDMTVRLPTLLLLEQLYSLNFDAL